MIQDNGAKGCANDVDCDSCHLFDNVLHAKFGACPTGGFLPVVCAVDNDDCFYYFKSSLVGTLN